MTARRLPKLLRTALRIGLAVICLYGLSVAGNVAFSMTKDFERPLPENARIVVLSHVTGRISKLRVDVGLDIYNRYGASEFIVTGYLIDVVMAERAQNGGIPDSIIVEESRARSTLQNALFVRDMIDDPHLPTILITERFHLLRAYWSFRWAGFSDVILYPSDQRSDYLSRDAAKLFCVEGLKWFANLIRAGVVSLPGVPKSSYPWLLE